MKNLITVERQLELPRAHARQQTVVVDFSEMSPKTLNELKTFVEREISYRRMMGCRHVR